MYSANLISAKNFPAINPIVNIDPKTKKAFIFRAKNVK